MKDTTLVLAKSEYAALRETTAHDALPRVVPISRGRISRVKRRRDAKAALLAKRDVTQEPYYKTSPLLERKRSRK